MDVPDLEKGSGDHKNQNRSTSTGEPSALPQESVRRNPHFRSELEIFQGLVGINHLEDGGQPKKKSEADNALYMNPLLAIFFPSKTKQQRMRNRGLYNRAVTQDLKNRSMYTITHYIISGLYLLQILVAATLTALSASSSVPSAALTTLGAINTVIAGLLAWLTGQGMPTRFRRARDQYREVVRACEAMERRFANIDSINWPKGQRPDPVTERDKLNKMFEDARKDQEANYPDATQAPQADKDKEDMMDLRDEVTKSKSKRKAMEARLIEKTEEWLGEKEELAIINRAQQKEMDELKLRMEAIRRESEELRRALAQRG